MNSPSSNPDAQSIAPSLTLYCAMHRGEPNWQSNCQGKHSKTNFMSKYQDINIWLFFNKIDLRISSYLPSLSQMELDSGTGAMY